MKFGTGIGIVISCIGIAMGATMEGTNVMVVINIPAILIVLVGTLGATIAACGLPVHIRLPKLYMKAIMPPDLMALLKGKDVLVGVIDVASDQVETPEQVADSVRTWRASVLDAMSRVPRRSQTLALVRGTAGDGAIVALNAEHARQESELPHKGPRS